MAADDRNAQRLDHEGNEFQAAAVKDRDRSTLRNDVRLTLLQHLLGAHTRNRAISPTFVSKIRTEYLKRKNLLVQTGQIGARSSGISGI